MPPIEELRAKYAEASEAFEPEHPLRETVQALQENGLTKDEKIKTLEQQLKEQKQDYEARIKEFERKMAQAPAESLKMMIRYNPSMLEDIDKLRQVAKDLGITDEEIREMLPTKMPLTMYKDAAGRTMPRAKYEAILSLVRERLGLD